jgi:ATP-dependent DNA helicase RecG
MEGIRQVDVPEYPGYGVREALANTLAHRDWSLEGAKVRLFTLDERLEAEPGRRVATASNLLSRRHSRPSGRPA